MEGDGDGLGWACSRTRTTSRGVTVRECQWMFEGGRRVRARGIPSNEVMREPVVAESIFWVIEVVTSTGLPIIFGSAGMSRAPLPAGCSILSCD